MSKDLIIFMDSGDTLIDESTQVFDSHGYVTHARMFEGVEKMLRELHKDGYRIALVADGRTKSFQNVYAELGLGFIFEEWIISEELGEEKPSPVMFRTAMEKMGLTEADKERIVMIGNNLKRDVLGANRLGLTSILVSCSPRYVMQPETPEETPDYVVAHPSQLTELLHQLDLQIKNRQILKHIVKF